MRNFEQMNPVVIAVYYLCVLGITMFSMNPLLLGISLLSSAASGAADRSADRRANLFSAVLFLAAAVLNPVFVHNGVTVLFYVNDRPFTLEAVLYGVCAGEMITAALYRLRSLSKVMTSEKVLYLFGRISPKTALLLSLTLRYVALLRVRWGRIQDTQRALGLYDDGNLIDAVRGRARVLSILLTWTLENGIVTAESMEARGYNSTRRTSFAMYRIHADDVLVIAGCAVLTVLTAVGVINSDAVYYPRLSMNIFTPWGVAGAAAFTLLSVLPLIINAKETARWRSSVSRT